jgi:hypothetical protein
MATKSDNTETVELIDGTKVAVRPLKISLLRDFLKKFEGVTAVADNNEKSMDILIECVQIAMQQYKPELAKDIKALEDNIDLPTVYKIVEAASGVKLQDTSLLNM